MRPAALQAGFAESRECLIGDFECAGNVRFCVSGAQKHIVPGVKVYPSLYRFESPEIAPDSFRIVFEKNHRHLSVACLAQPQTVRDRLSSYSFSQSLPESIRMLDDCIAP